MPKIGQVSGPQLRGDGRMAATTFGREATVIGNLDKPYPLVTGSA